MLGKHSSRFKYDGAGVDLPHILQLQEVIHVTQIIISVQVK